MINLELTEEQARIVCNACEFFARIRYGQFDNIILYNLDTRNTDNIIERKQKAKELLYQARLQIYPELQGMGTSYGMGTFKDADLSFDVYQAVRTVLGDPRTPFSFYEIPKCYRVTEESSLKKEYKTNNETDIKCNT